MTDATVPCGMGPLPPVGECHVCAYVADCPRFHRRIVPAQRIGCLSLVALALVVAAIMALCFLPWGV